MGDMEPGSKDEQAQGQHERVHRLLIASPGVVSGTEAACMRPNTEAGPAHDAFTALLHHLESEPISSGLRSGVG